MCMPWISASGDEVWDINLLVPSLSFWARGRVGNTVASNANLQHRYNSVTKPIFRDACNAIALIIVTKTILNTTDYRGSLHNSTKYYSLPTEM